MKDEASIVEQYADSDVGKRIEILIRYYPNFIRLVEGFEQSLGLSHLKKRYICVAFIV